MGADRSTLQNCNPLSTRPKYKRIQTDVNGYETWIGFAKTALDCVAAVTMKYNTFDKPELQDFVTRTTLC
jgi:hypothetical protein